MIFEGHSIECLMQCSGLQLNGEMRKTRFDFSTARTEGNCFKYFNNYLFD